MNIRRLIVLWCCLAGIALHQETRAAESKEFTIMDYFAQLPPRTFEGSAAEMVHFLKQQGTIIDKKNGYIRCGGDGAQGDFEVALFRYRDRRPLVVVSTGSTDGEKGSYLQFIEGGADGKLRRIDNFLFPIADVGQAENGAPSEKWHFDLPRFGKTILVRSTRSGQIVQKVTWDGEKFQKDK